MFQRILVRVKTFFRANWFFKNEIMIERRAHWKVEHIIDCSLSKKAKRLTLNCIFFTQYLVLSWTFLHNKPAACLSKDNYGLEIILLWWSVFQQTTATTECISTSMVWGNDGEAAYEPHVDPNCRYYAISTIILMPYWKWTICLSEDYNKICYLYLLKKDLPTNQDLTYRDNLVDYTLSDDVTISHYFIIIYCLQWYTLWGE